MIKSKFATITAVILGTSLALFGALPAIATTSNGSGDNPGKLAWLAAQPSANAPDHPSIDYRTGTSQPLLLVGGGVTPNAQVPGNGTLSGSRSVRVSPPGGSPANIYASFSSSASNGSPHSGQPITVNGSSQVTWAGSSPHNANNISLTDSIWSTGLSLTVGVGAVSGAVGSGGNTATLHTAFNNRWNIHHAFSGFQFGGLVWTMNERADSNATFGTTTFYNQVN